MYYRSTQLSTDQIQRSAPSVFAEHPHVRVSDRYQFISTRDMIAGLGHEGWLPVHAQESQVRLLDRKGYAKHMLRFRRLDDTIPMEGDSVFEIVLVNSHDGSSTYRLYAGMFRFICSNGMIIDDATMSLMKQRHTGDAVISIIEGTHEIVAELPRIAAKVATFRAIPLSIPEQETFARSALGFRWHKTEPVTARQLNEPRRVEDVGSDLWTTYQRVQENVTKGGIRGKSKNGRRMTTRAVKAIDTDVKLNKALWLLTEQMAQMKGA